MESGFGQNLEGFLIKGNLSLAPSANPTEQGDGSIEGSGTLYFDILKEYNTENGVNIQDVLFKNGVLNIPYVLPSVNLTSASVIIDGGMSLKHTQNSTSITSGGGLTIAGGVSIGKDVNIGGVLNVNNNRIKNVSTPILGLDAVNKDYVDLVSGNVSGNFTTGQVIIADSDGDLIRGYDFFTTDTEKINMSIPLLISSGSTSLNVYGSVNLNSNSIINVKLPIDNSDAVNKYYVDNLINDLTNNLNNLTIGSSNISGNFTSGQVIIADSGGNIRGYDTFLYDGVSLTILGGVEISGLLDVNGNNIKNVATPILGSDAVNKDYIDNIVSNISVGSNINGNFTSGQIIIGDSNGNIKGYDNIVYNNTEGILKLNENTSLLIENTTSDALKILGGAFIGDELDVNMKNIRNVALPILGTDAVNKNYVDNAISNISVGTGGSCCITDSSKYYINNNILIPEDIPEFYYPSSIKAFTSNVYVTVNEKSSLVTIYGMNIGLGGWLLTTNFIGERLNVKFYIRDNYGTGVIQYTNLNTEGTSYITFETTSRIDNLENSLQKNISINTTNIYTDIYDIGIGIDSIKLLVYVSSEIDNNYSLFFINGILTDGIWKLSKYNINNSNDNNTNVDFNISVLGKLQYKNTNVSVDYTLRIIHTDFFINQIFYTLYANTLVPLDINILGDGNGINNYQISLVASDNLGLSALYEINAVLTNDLWKVSSRYIGNDLGIKFYIDEYTGVLKYINNNSLDVYIRYIRDVPNTFEPLSVIYGGTGNIELLPYSVLRGDGTNPIVGTDEFIYKDYTLTVPSVIIKDTQNVTSLTEGGSLVIEGGVSIKKDVYIGGELDMNMMNIKKVATPIDDYDAVNKLYIDNLDLNNNDNIVEQSFNLNNNVSIPEDIPGFVFSNELIKSFVSNVYVQVQGSTFELCSLYTLRGFSTDTDWILSSSLIGKSCGVNFYIKFKGNYGQIQYTNQNTSGISYVRYTTNTLIYTDDNDLIESQLNYNLLGNQLVYQEISSLNFLNNTLNSVKLFIYVSSVIDNKYGLILANCVHGNDNVWDITTFNIGNVSGIKLNIKSNVDSGVIEYTNSNLSNDYKIRVVNIDIKNEIIPFVLNANVISPIVIDADVMSIDVRDCYFQMTIFVNVPYTNKSALYEIQGIVCDNIWDINSRYIGDYTGIKFYINTIDDKGYLTYTNNNNTDAYIRFIKDVPLSSLRPLHVSKGGTSSTYFNPYTILRGNGVDPIVGTNDLIFRDNDLIIGNRSSIIIKNTQSSTSLTSASFVVYGGASINKELEIGDSLIVNNVNLTPNVEDINSERVFYADNNILSPSNVLNFSFDQVNTKSFSSMVCVNILTDFDEYDALFELKGLKKRTGWILDSKYIGDDTGIVFTINTSGQIQYTSNNTPDWISTIFKYRALTTTAN